MDEFFFGERKQGTFINIYRHSPSYTPVNKCGIDIITEFKSEYYSGYFPVISYISTLKKKKEKKIKSIDRGKATRLTTLFKKKELILSGPVEKGQLILTIALQTSSGENKHSERGRAPGIISIEPA